MSRIEVLGFKFWIRGVFVLCLLWHTPLFAQISEPTDNLKNVKSLDIYLYKAYDLEVKNDVVTFFKKKQTVAHTLIEYDKNGNEIVRNYYNLATEKPQESYVYQYDSNNRKTLEMYVLQGIAFGGKTTYSYDQQGRKKEILVYSAKEELKDRLLYEYDSLGNLVAEKSPNTLSMMIKEVLYKYDERNNLIEKKNVKTTFVKEDDLFREIYLYDEHNRLISKVHYDGKDAFVWIYTVKYDAHNRIVSEETKNSKGKVTSSATYTYNKKGQLISTYNFDIAEKIPPMRIDYQYDKKGLNTLRHIYVQNAQTPTITKRYYYDDKGNWVRWWEFNHTDNTHAIANRKITYY